MLTALSSPGWHRRQRKRRQRARKVLQWARRKGRIRSSRLPRLLAARALLQGHHTCPYYFLDNIEVDSPVEAFSRTIRPASTSRTTSRSMTWRRPQTWKQPWNQWEYGWEQPGRKQDPKKKAEAKSTMVGYDGKKLHLSSSSLASSSKESQNQVKQQGGELTKIKQLLTEMAKNGNSLDPSHPTLRALLEESEESELKAEQRLLNMKRRARRKVEALRKQLATKDADFKAWKANVKSLIQEEGKRHEAAMLKLQEDLTKAEEEAQKVGEDQEDTNMPSESETSEEESARWVQPDSKVAEMMKALEQSTQRCQDLEFANHQILAQLRIATSSSPCAMTPMATSPSTNALKSYMPSMRPFGSGKARVDPYLTPEAKEKQQLLTADIINDLLVNSMARTNQVTDAGQPIMIEPDEKAENADQEEPKEEGLNGMEKWNMENLKPESTGECWTLWLVPGNFHPKVSICRRSRRARSLGQVQIPFLWHADTTSSTMSASFSIHHGAKRCYMVLSFSFALWVFGLTYFGQLRSNDCNNSLYVVMTVMVNLGYVANIDALMLEISIKAHSRECYSLLLWSHGDGLNPEQEEHPMFSWDCLLKQQPLRPIWFTQSPLWCINSIGMRSNGMCHLMFPFKNTVNGLADSMDYIVIYSYGTPFRSMQLGHNLWTPWNPSSCTSFWSIAQGETMIKALC